MTESNAGLKERLLELNREIKEDPNNPVLYHERGLVKLNIGEIEDAEADFLFAIEYLPREKTLSSWYNLGSVYAETGRNADARRAWLEVIKLNEHNVMGLYSLAKLAVEEKDYSTALQYALRADAANRNRSLKLIPQILGTIYWFLGRKEEARFAWQKLIDIDDYAPEGYELMANSYVQDGEYSEALALYKKVIEKGAARATTYYNIALTEYNLGDYSQAIMDFERAVKMGYNSAELQVGLGLAYFAKEDSDKAIAHFREALELNPAYYPAHYHVGEVFARHGFHERALDEWQKVLSISQGYLPAYLGCAAVYMNMKKYAEARDILLQAHDINPKSDIIKINLAEVYLYLRDPENVLYHAQSAALLDERNPLAFALSAIAYILQEDYELAVVAWEQAIEINEQIMAYTAHLIAATVSDKSWQKFLVEANKSQILQKIFAK